DVVPYARDTSCWEGPRLRTPASTSHWPHSGESEESPVGTPVRPRAPPHDRDSPLAPVPPTCSSASANGLPLGPLGERRQPHLWRTRPRGPGEGFPRPGVPATRRVAVPPT